MSMDFDLAGTRELAAALRAAGPRVYDVLGKAGYREAEGIMGDSKAEVPVDMGTLRASGFVRPPKREGTDVVIEMGYGGAASGYATYIHEGTGPAVGRPPFMPPVAPFKDWARRVLGDESAGYAVARAVGQRGLAPRKFLENPLKARLDSMGSRLAGRIRRMLGRG